MNAEDARSRQRTADITDGPDRDDLQRALFHPQRKVRFSYLVDGKERFELRGYVHSIHRFDDEGIYFIITGSCPDLGEHGLPFTVSYNPTTGKGTLRY